MVINFNHMLRRLFWHWRNLYLIIFVHYAEPHPSKAHMRGAFPYSGLIVCAMGVLFFHIMVLFMIIDDYFFDHQLYKFTSSVLFFTTHKGPVNLLVVINLFISFGVGWFVCFYHLPYEDAKARVGGRRPLWLCLVILLGTVVLFMLSTFTFAVG